MSTTEPRAQRIRSALANLSGRNTIDQITDYLKRQGAYDFDFAEAEREFTRGLLRRHHRWARKTGRIADDQIALFEIDDEGNKINYYKRADELTIDEAGKHLDTLRAIVEKDERILSAYMTFYTSKFGDDIQGHLGF